MDALELEASSTVSTRNTSFRRRSDWLYTTLTIPTWNEPADLVRKMGRSRGLPGLGFRGPRTYGLGVEDEDLHAGDVLEHAVDVIPDERDQHHFCCYCALFFSALWCRCRG